MGLIISFNPFQNRGWQGALSQTVQLVRQGISNAARRDFQMDVL